jgi:hypothetical protein
MAARSTPPGVCRIRSIGLSGGGLPNRWDDLLGVLEIDHFGNWNAEKAPGLLTMDHRDHSAMQQGSARPLAVKYMTVHGRRHMDQGD